MVFEQFVGSEPADPVRDPRITRVLDWLVAQQGESDVTAADAAGVACLSESRFSHVFVKEVGLPFRTFLLWRRLTRAVDQRPQATA